MRLSNAHIIQRACERDHPLQLFAYVYAHSTTKRSRRHVIVLLPSNTHPLHHQHRYTCFALLRALCTTCINRHLCCLFFFSTAAACFRGRRVLPFLSLCPRKENTSSTAGWNLCARSPSYAPHLSVSHSKFSIRAYLPPPPFSVVALLIIIMPPKQDNVQKLLAAEERRSKLISDAKARKQQRVKQAKVDAEHEVASFRAEKDREYDRYRAQQNSGADAENAELARETDRELEELKNLTAQRMDAVANMMARLIVTVKE
ncbi:(H+)-ATPase G subunit, putative [Leishmania tarentolae]|uniref:(H+)-ATPase G subunit, putative n=1 Tax=Leishmania tarentolae TaxID=5689 RepID=A0A640KHK4_LEITA|nr:(H+)-ATPase G subunit, putative [Leishmania tarentolae]